MTTLWDTTGTDVIKALAAERRAAGAVAFGLALTLVVVVEERNVRAAETAATTAAAAHPCRLLIVVRRHVGAPDSRLDAEVSIGGRLGPGEAVVMRMYGRLGLHAESVVLPLLASDAPVVTWWHGDPPERIAYDPLGVFADRRVTDVTSTADPLAALRQRAVDYAPGDTDLAWARVTPWRTLLAAAMDSVTDRPVGATVAAASSDASAALLTGWLRRRLQVPVHLGEAPGQGVGAVGLELPGGAAVRLRRHRSQSALLTKPNQADRVMPLPERALGDLLAEELRRLDADPPYAESLATWSGLGDLGNRSPHREHIWRDPAQEAAAQVTA